MKKQTGLSKYKLRKIATESLRNAIRLHFDSILLYKNESYPSAFHISVLALEEFSKANWVNHYVWSSETNDNYPDEKFEQKWLKLLYHHSRKQWNFVARETEDYSPKFISLIRDGKLEEKKQDAVYVGLPRVEGKISSVSKISLPSRIKQKDAKQIISIINDELLRICSRIEEDEFYYDGVYEMDDVFDYGIYKKLLNWPHKSGLRNSGWWKRNRNRN